MSNQPTIAIFERDNTITPSKLRTIGYIPATVYGKDQEPISIQLKAHEFELALAKRHREFTLAGLGKTLNVEVKQLQKNSVKGTTLHVEFYVPSAGGSKAAKAPKAEAAVLETV
jgi:ribosomal protein L25 (general stress protein Ctc)